MVAVTDYGLIARAVYDEEAGEDVAVARARLASSGWVRAHFRDGLGTGLQAAVYTKGNVTIASFKGTTPSQGSDIVADVKLGIGMNTSYFSAAEAFCTQYANVSNLVVTGHSLGGAIAQIVGNRRRIPFVTFNAPGVAIVASRNLASATSIGSAVRVVGGAVSMLRHPMQAMRDMSSAFHSSLGVNFRLSGDVISQIGLHYGNIVSIQASGNPLDQHGMAMVNTRLAATGYGDVNFPS